VRVQYMNVHEYVQCVAWLIPEMSQLAGHDLDEKGCKSVSPVCSNCSFESHKPAILTALADLTIHGKWEAGQLLWRCSIPTYSKCEWVF
jgi:hypothetical protein